MDRRYSTTADAAGAATIRIQPTGVQPWLVTQVSVEMETDASATCVLRKNGFAVTPLVAQLDAAGGDPSVELQMNDELTVEWTNANPGDVGKVLIFYELMT